jgi:hypothetical protein
MIGKSKTYGSFISVTIIAALLFSMAFITNVEALQKTAASGSLKTADSLMQFTAGRHVLGFMPNKVYLASLDHALSVEFLGTKGVIPKSDRHRPANKHNQALPLGKVTYDNLWKGISLSYEPSKNGITESTYHISPNADVSKIRLQYNVPVELQKDGKLNIKFSNGYMTESAPVAWQEIDGKRIPVKIAFKVAKQEVGFSVAKYDPRYVLIIDPAYSWHTFYGSSSDRDDGNAIAIDSGGNVYVAGNSYWNWNGPSGQAPLRAYRGGRDIVVVKLNSSGTYQWHTFYGSTDNDFGAAIAIDSGDNIYISGDSVAAWNGPGDEAPLNAFHEDYYGYSDIFVLKLNSSGTYQWHTFYGSTDDDFGYGIALDSSGHINVIGESYWTWNGPGDEAPLHARRGDGDTSDIFVLQLSSSGTYRWHTFYGSGDDDYVYSIATSNSGSIYVAGESFWTWSGPNGEEPIHARKGDDTTRDIFILKLNSSGAYQWHTFYGSGNGDRAPAIAADSGGSVYATGMSMTAWNGDGATPPLHYHSGYSDIFVLRLNGSGTYQWHTFYGSNNSADYGTGIAVDSGGNIYVTGYSDGSWRGSNMEEPLHPYNYSNVWNGNTYDMFVLKLDNSGAYQWHTFYGSTDDDYGLGLALDGSDNLYVTGTSWATWNGDGGTPPLHAYRGHSDIFVLKLEDISCDTNAVRISETGAPYSSIASAYAAAATGQTIQARARDFTGDLNLTSAISIAIMGGYDCGFLTNTGYTTVTGNVTIQNGTVILDRIIIN